MGYVEQFEDACPLTGDHPHARVGTECSEKLMQKVGLDVEKVRQCVVSTQDEKLRKQRDHTAWSPRALRINGWRYTGMMDADLVTRAVCAGFAEKPKECEELVSERDPTAKFGGAASGEAVSFSTFLWGLFGVAALAFVMLCCYKRTLQASLKSSVREEVMLEVQAAMSQYNRLHGQEL